MSKMSLAIQLFAVSMLYVLLSGAPAEAKWATWQNQNAAVNELLQSFDPALQVAVNPSSSATEALQELGVLRAMEDGWLPGSYQPGYNDGQFLHIACQCRPACGGCPK